MTQKKGGAVKSGGAKAVAGGHNVAKGGFQKAKAGALQSKAFLGKKELVPKGKAGSPQVGKQQQKPGARGNNQSPRGGKNGKSVQAKKGKFEDEDDDDEDDDEDEEDEDDIDDEEDMDDDGDDDDDEEDAELSDDEENSAPKKKQQSQPPKQATTPKSILKKTGTTPQADDEKVPKLVPIAAKETPKGGQQAAKNAKQDAAKAVSEKPKSAKEQKGSDDAFKLIANVDCEPLTAAQRGEFETRVKRFANATVFIKGLHRRCSEDDLRKLVKDVITIRLPVHEKRGSQGARSRGYAFLEFKDEATARRSVDFLNKEAQLMNSEGQACKLEASISAAGGYVMAADDWNVGSLYVSGIPNRATEDDLSKLFDRDQLVTVVLPRNRFTGTARGCAHIRFRSAEASIKQFDAARAKLLRGEFSINGQALTVAFSSRQTLKRERAEQTSKDNQKPAATDNKKVAETSKPAPASQNQTPKSAAASNAGGSATKALAKATPTNAAANKSLNESAAKKGANDSIVKKQVATPVQNSAQKGATKRKLEEETARKAKVAKRDEEEDDDDEDDDDEEDDEDDEDEDDDDDDE